MFVFLIPFDHGYLFYFGRERESLYLPLTGKMLLAMWHYSVIHHGTCERSSSLLVTRVPVAPQGLGSTPRVGANLSRYNGVCAFSGRRCSRRQWGARGDFVNLEDLSSQSSKMFLRVGFACVFIGMNIRALWVHAMYCVIRKKNHHGTCYSAAGQMLILRWCTQFLPLREWRQRTSVLQPGNLLGGFIPGLFSAARLHGTSAIPVPRQASKIVKKCGLILLYASLVHQWNGSCAIV
jgi:hypothetical protein